MAGGAWWWWWKTVGWLREISDAADDGVPLRPVPLGANKLSMVKTEDFRIGAVGDGSLFFSDLLFLLLLFDITDDEVLNWWWWCPLLDNKLLLDGVVAAADGTQMEPAIFQIILVILCDEIETDVKSHKERTRLTLKVQDWSPFYMEGYRRLRPPPPLLAALFLRGSSASSLV